MRRVASSAELRPFLRHNCVRDQVEECVAKEASRRKAEQHLQQPTLLLTVVQGDEEQDDERRDADGERRSHCLK